MSGLEIRRKRDIARDQLYRTRVRPYNPLLLSDFLFPIAEMANTEKTFRSYTSGQGKNYAQNRLDYHQDVYNLIVEHHTSTGGKLDTLIDVGCGPGNVASNLSKHFVHTIGLDPSEGMIATARALNSSPADDSGKLRFEVSTAEDLGSNLSPPIADSSIDMIVAATAAHWFDMPAFWRSAARVLKSGGSVAIWGSANMRTSPGTPNAEAIQARIDQFEAEIQPYFLPGNVVTRGLYKDLGLPWTVEPAVEGFDEKAFFRKDWDTTEKFLALGAPEIDMGVFERMLGTMSPVTRWREDHPEATGEEDIVRVFRRDIERLLREAGVEEGKEKLKGSAQGFLLIVKKT
ncbi:putative S-adenosylmethionine-dependent methyltransferase [Aspergillus foveolatus]|uniref:putative S-adenosylmethionine-dependent methyltransferase n=1 Tax=Aspergillus foveolatus TaxID=210207 RepID=UPI003CCCD495